MIWSAIRSQIVYRAIIDSFPPQFQDELDSRYAFHVLVFYPPTPLPLQAEYLKSLWGGCASFFCISLVFFLARNWPFGGFFLIFFGLAVFETIKSRKTYQENCKRALTQHPEEEP